MPTDLEEKLILSEYESLRTEIQARLLRMARLQEGLLLGTLIYVTTLFVPGLIRSEASVPAVQEFALLLFALFVFIMPFVAFAVEIASNSEQDAIFRVANYLRDNIESKYRSSTFRGWEDWLERQDRVKRRRLSDELAIHARRLVIGLYCFASSVILGIGASSYTGPVPAAGIGLALLVLYLLVFRWLVQRLKRARQEEFDSPFYDLFVVDLDGCLFDSSRRISELNRKALQAIGSMGVQVVLATGRPSLSLRQICKDLGLRGLHVASHGAVILDANMDQERAISPIPAPQVLESLRYLESKSIPWAAFGARCCYVSESQEPDLSRNLMARGDVPRPDLVVAVAPADIDRWQEEASKILCFVGVGARRQERGVRKSLGPDLKAIRSTAETLEIVSSTTSKVASIKIIRTEYGMEDAEILAVGDQDNDLELLEWSGVRQPVAPSNASRAVKKLAGINVLRASNDQDLIWHIVRTYFELPEIERVAESRRGETRDEPESGG